MQQEGELVAENELAAVNNLANAAVANGLMQHPNQPQYSYSVSSETSAFYRAEGPQVTLELPLPAVSADRSSADTLVVSRFGTQNLKSDYQIRELANRPRLHQRFGPSPSVEMLLQDLAQKAQEIQSLLPMKNPVLVSSWNFWPDGLALDTWLLRTDNPHWGNNAEAATSSGYKRPRLELIRNDVAQEPNAVLKSGPGQEIVPYNHSFAVRQILSNLHPQMQSAVHQAEQNEEMNNMQMDIDLEDEHHKQLAKDAIEAILVENAGLGISSPCSGQRKRKARAKTPIVDDEVKRSLRFKKKEAIKHIQLDREPRRRKGEATKTVYYSSVEDLKSAIISRSLDEDLEEAEEIEPIQAVTLVELGTSFCGIPSVELTIATLNQDEE